MLAVVLMGGLTVSCGSEEETIILGNFTIGYTISDKGTLPNDEYEYAVVYFSRKEVTIDNVSESRAREAFEVSFKNIDLSKLSTTYDYTVEYFLKNPRGEKIATHYIIIKNGQATTK